MMMADGAAPFDIVHAHLLRFFPELVAELGGDAAALLARAGIDPALPAGGGTTTYRQVIALLEHAAATLACPDFGLRLARRQGGHGVFGDLGVLMRNSRTFGEALDYVRTHMHAHSPAARNARHAFPEDGMILIAHEILLDRLRPQGQAIEQVMLLGHLAAIEMTGGHVRARRVHFRHRPAAAPRIYRRYFGCEVRFERQEDGLFFTDADLARPIVDADAHAYRAIASYIEAAYSAALTPLHLRVRSVMLRSLGSEAGSNAGVAAALGLHPRTLHRRLAAEGTSFHRVKDEIRRDVLLYYLRHTDLDLSRISERMGFAEQSVLTRRCHAWFAASPRTVRARLRQGGPI